MLLSILIYSLLKIKKYQDAKNLLDEYVFDTKNSIFTFNFLKCKVLYLLGNVCDSINLLYEMLEMYESFKNNNENNENNENNNNIVYIETFDSEFLALSNFFIYLFSINNIDSKIKKIYFEIKICFTTLNFEEKAYETILNLEQKYPNDIQIIFEVSKMSIYMSQFQKFNEGIEKLKKLKENNEYINNKILIDNYINNLECLYLFIVKNYEECENKYKKSMLNEQSDAIYLNNMSLLNIYINKPDVCHRSLIAIADKNKIDFNNEVIQYNFEILNKFFLLPKYNP